MPEGEQVEFVTLPLLEVIDAMSARPALDPEWEACAPAASDDCDANVAPAFGTPVYIINGLQYADLTEVQNGDSVALLVPVEDPECNLGCGEFRSGLYSGASDGGFAGSLPSNVPCSSTASGIYLGLSLPIATTRGPGLDGREDHYDYTLGVVDRCGAASEALEGSLTVLFEDEPPLEVPPKKPSGGV